MLKLCIFFSLSVRLTNGSLLVLEMLFFFAAIITEIVHFLKNVYKKKCMALYSALQELVVVAFWHHPPLLIFQW